MDTLREALAQGSGGENSSMAQTLDLGLLHLGYISWCSSCVSHPHSLHLDTSKVSELQLPLLLACDWDVVTSCHALVSSLGSHAGWVQGLP